MDGIILCDGNYRMGAYGMDLVHSRPMETRAKPGNHLVSNKSSANIILKM